jgi:hypothetical protein
MKLTGKRFFRTFIPQISRLCAVSERVGIIELFFDCMPKMRLIPVLSFPNILNSFPKQLPALTSLCVLAVSSVGRSDFG